MSDWRKEFREKFKNLYVTDDTGGYDAQIYVEEFIDQLLEKQRQDMLHGINPLLEEKIKELLDQAKKEQCFCDCHFRESIHNPDRGLCNLEKQRKEEIRNLDEEITAISLEFMENIIYIPGSGTYDVASISKKIHELIEKARREERNKIIEEEEKV